MKIRQSLVLILWVALMASCAVDTPERTVVPFYIGTYTSAGSEGIYVSDLDTVSGALSSPRLVASVANPSYVNFTADGQYLLAASEAGVDAPDLFVYRREISDNSLTLVDSLFDEGSGACYVSEVGDGWVALAHYSSGDVVFIPIAEDGTLAKNKVVRYVHEGSGPDSMRQEQSHVHSVIPDLEGRYAYVADLGADKVMVYEVKADTVVPVKAVYLAPGAGPRHMAIHPSGDYMTIMNELNSTIDLLVKDSMNIYSKLRKSVALLPDSTARSNTAADIHFSADGKYLYATVRGVDQLFMLSAGDKDIGVMGFVNEGIEWPRNFSLDPSGHFVLVANRNGNSIIVYKRDRASGILTPTSGKIVLNQPVCIRF
ncbi:lactonase family protein [Geofilum sp. OHC36d9]|uniref:lactonase family protein n=1 Tax=Geofilum sp. OHC36d9 TaxID=3458413 RepID=UPI0040334D2E